MTIATGDTLPEATLTMIGADGPEQVPLADRLKGKKVVIFGVPGAFTGTCSTAHMPSFIRTKDKFDEKGVDEIICVAVNDPFVQQAWGESTGALEAGITMMADARSELAKALGVNWSAPAIGFFDRSQRYVIYTDDGVVKVFHEEAPAVCETTSGEAILSEI